MATDWKALSARFIKEHSRTGISVKDWCEIHNLNLATARRHIKLSTNKKGVQRKKPKVRNTKREVSMQNRPLANDEDLTNQLVIDEGTDTETNNAKREILQKQKRGTQFTKGNQAARTFGHYSEFVFTEEDAARYASSEKASLLDELHLTRMQHSNLLVEIKRLENDLADPNATIEIRESLYKSYAKFSSVAERRVARIESLENSLFAHEKSRIDMEKSKALTRKATLEADKLERDTSSSQTPLEEIYKDILAMGGDGMMNTD